MIDETKIIKRLEKRIDDFIKSYPFKKDSVEVQIVYEFIHMLKKRSRRPKETTGIVINLLITAYNC